MSQKLVSLNQGQQVRKMANDKKIGSQRFQEALDDGSLGRFLDDLKVDSEASSELTPPPGARIHTIRIRFKPDREWQEAVTAAGPDTPDSYNVRKVGDQYPSTGTEEIEEDLILLNYPSGDGNWDKALAWAGSKKLKNTVPREVFAVGEQHPTLHNKLGLNPMYVVATTPCTFDGRQRACYVWWRDSERRARLDWSDSFDEQRGWFAFRKPVLKAKTP